MNDTTSGDTRAPAEASSGVRSDASGGASSGGTSSASAPSRGDSLLVLVFWVWAVVLLVATLAQLLGWDGVLDVLDVKRWFAA